MLSRVCVLHECCHRFCFLVQSYPPVKTRNSVGTIADAAERRRRLRMAKSVDTLFYGGVLRGNAAVGQFIQDGGHTIVNPYAGSFETGFRNGGVRWCNGYNA